LQTPRTAAIEKTEALVNAAKFTAGRALRRPSLWNQIRSRLQLFDIKVLFIIKSISRRSLCKQALGTPNTGDRNLEEPEAF
jgi:hypothetical protein